MIRQSLPRPKDPRFRLRCHEVSRLEAFTDAVFGFALTLLVVSLEVPKTAEDLLKTMRAFPAFAVCFAALLQIWWLHNRFFRRYGLNDMPVFLLNSVLLFVVLFYVYPLKFLFGGLFSGGLSMTVGQGRDVLTIYSAGLLAVSALFALMHHYALRRADHLELSAVERLLTVQSAAHDWCLAGVGAASILIARLAPPQLVPFAGWIFFGIPIPMFIVGSYYGARARQLAAASITPSPAQTA